MRTYLLTLVMLIAVFNPDLRGGDGTLPFEVGTFERPQGLEDYPNIKVIVQELQPTANKNSKNKPKPKVQPPLKCDETSAVGIKTVKGSIDTEQGLYNIVGVCLSPDQSEIIARNEKGLPIHLLTTVSKTTEGAVVMEGVIYKGKDREESQDFIIEKKAPTDPQ